MPSRMTLSPSFAATMRLVTQTSAGICMPRARMAVWEVMPPSWVIMPKIRPASRSMMSAGEMSSAASIRLEGSSAPCPAPESLSSMRSPTARMSWALSCKYGSSMPLKTSQSLCTTWLKAHDALTSSSAMSLPVDSTSLGSFVISFWTAMISRYSCMSSGTFWQAMSRSQDTASRAACSFSSS